MDPPSPQSVEAGPRWQRAVPWICLALFFYLPGVYLEFPADPWQHYARVNEWSWLPHVTDHPFWTKWSYFFAYSLVGGISLPLAQLKAFDGYYTGCCLLLCWQYYRLSRALGLGPRPSLGFVVLQALLAGNFLFGFYRYYGMSSAVFAQLGAVALIRLALVASASEPGGARFDHPGQTTRFRSLLVWPPAVLLLGLTAFNHLQGVGIAAFGVAAVLVGRLVAWRRPALGWLLAAAAVLSVAAVVWWPRHPALDATYRPGGWLTAWYGFNLFSLSSPASARAAAILGWFGLINLAAGLVLLRRNHVVGWMTVLPVVALGLPCLAIPLANTLAARPVSTGEDILVFSRMLFAIPCGLALVALAAEGDGRRRFLAVSSGRFPRVLAVASLPLGLLALTVVPPGGLFFNRLFNALMVPPDDLAMRHVLQSPGLVALSPQPRLPDLIAQPEQTFLERGGIFTTPGIGYVMNATGGTLIDGTTRRLVAAGAPPPSVTTPLDVARLAQVSANPFHAAPFPVRENLFSPVSQTGYLSTHWMPQEVPLVHATQDELFARPASFTGAATAPEFWVEWSGSRSNRSFSTRNLPDPPAPQTGAPHFPANSGTGEQRIQAGDWLTFRPVMRTAGGNGWALDLQVRGPGLVTHREYFGRPSPLGRPSQIAGTERLRLQQPGEYTVELTGKLFWPTQTKVVRYYFIVQPGPP